MRILALTLLAFLIVGFQSLAKADGVQVSPEFPSRNIDTRTLMRNAESGLYETQAPHIPVHEISLDGRLALKKRRDKELGTPIYVMRPETVSQYFLHDDNAKVGGNLLGDHPDAYFDMDKFRSYFPIALKNSFHADRAFLCEKEEVNRNPYVCGEADDCYALTFIQRYEDSSDTTTDKRKYSLVSIDIVVHVKDPKTPIASVRKIVAFPKSMKQTGTPVGAPAGSFLEFKKFAEPIVVGDGRLLLVRFGEEDNLKLTDGRDAGEGIDIVYSVYPAKEGGELTPKCDVSRWTQFYPISHAHHDSVNNMQNRYKFARYQFRDSLGRFVEDGVNMGGSYQWMDKDAANMFFTSVGRDRFYNAKGGVSFDKPYEELDTLDANYFMPSFDIHGIDNVEELSANTALTFVAGFWTHGKMIALDGLVNNVDYNFHIADRKVNGKFESIQRKLKLYHGVPSYIDQDFEPVGGVRELGVGFDLNQYDKNLSPNSSYLGSIENRFFYHDAMKPVTARDLVWHFGSTRHTDEIVLDDYVSPYNVINAEMTGATSGDLLNGSLRYFDGVRKGAVTQQFDWSAFDPRQSAETNLTPYEGQLLFQNAVSQAPNFFLPPYYGEPIGELRMEPLAKGGVHGKGVWFEGQVGIKFEIPDQTGMSFQLKDQKSWYVSVFLDPRLGFAAKTRTLWSLSSGNKVQLIKPKNNTAKTVFEQIALVNKDDKILSTINLSGLSMARGKWVNVGIEFTTGKFPRLYIDGFPVVEFVNGASDSQPQLLNFFNLMSVVSPTKPAIILGSATTYEDSVRGWLDDFKVTARAMNSEEICNFSRGTLISVDNLVDSPLTTKALQYPVASHSLIKTLNPTAKGNRFLCFSNYDDSSNKLHIEKPSANLKAIPADAESLREALLMEGKALEYGKVRPDFTTNKFCLSCHVTKDTYSYKEMDTRALTQGTVNMEDDLRRQPSQPERWFTGFVPKNYFGPGLPVNDLNGFPGKYKIDKWISRPK